MLTQTWFCTSSYNRSTPLDRKLFGFLSGWQFTVLASVAIITPGAVYAVATQAVSITDPNSGKQAYIDSSRRLSVYDPVSSLPNYPGNAVSAFGSSTGSCASIYTVPTDKALVVKSLSSFMAQPTSSENDLFLFYGPSSNPCSSPIAIAAVPTGGSTPSTISQTLGQGVAVPAGSVIGLQVTGGGSVFMYGYLVPPGTVPASPVAQAPALKRGGAPQVATGRL